VQRVMAQQAQEQFPAAADNAIGQIQDMANDPEAHKKAIEWASWGAHGAAALAEKEAKEVYALLQQGPKGVRVLAFAGGVLSFALGCWKLAHFWRAFIHPVQYAIVFYQMIFCSVTLVFEANPAHIQKMPRLDRLHDSLLEYCKFLSTCFGRGLFYMFQCSLWCVVVNYWLIFKAPLPKKGVTHECVTLGVGFYIGIIGMFNFLMHWDIMPVEVLEKSREVSAPAVAVASRMARQTVAWVQDKVETDTHKDSETGDKKKSLVGEDSEQKRGSSSGSKGGELEMQDRSGASSGPPAYAGAAHEGV